MVHTRLSLATILIGTLVLAAPARAGDPPRLLLQDIQPKGVAKEVASSLTDLLELEIERGRLFTVISQQDLRSLLQVEEQRIMMGVEEGQEDRMAAIATKVDAPFALAASIGKVGAAYTLSLRLFDVQKMTVVRRVNQTLVGQQEGLVGSLRAAALALTLEEKGIASDISESLIDDLKIAQKDKTLFLSLTPLYEVPLGQQKSDENLVTMRPAYMGFQLEASMPVWEWVQVFASIGLGFTIHEQEHQTSNDLSLIWPDGQQNPSTRLQGTGLTVDYQSLKVPVLVGVKMAPQAGRFLPYVQFGVGISYTTFSMSGGNLDLMRESPDNASCPDPFSPYDAEPDNPSNLVFCTVEDVKLDPAKNLGEVGLDAVGAAGFELLLSHNLGIKAEARYHMTYLFSSEADLRIQYSGQVPWPDGTTREEAHKDLAANNLSHSLAFAMGLVVYW